ncbi:MAG: bifunctional 4-hydroxy-2-oxoglutarate aldolase/2-dehydro-3-deoxy-phosphogluconate aldolase [Ruminococcaceae bacterium]|nr:bifunctional 4-hydroxy-2-oxoglutarate aldolase/2-dehydro-3-deoxy-phosphogluconate aldolase [Oscillospiraceae bacterium]
MDVMKQMEQLGVVPVVVLDDVKDAVPLAKAMQAGGIPCAEVTLRTAAGLSSIEKMRELGDILVGAGTVVTLDQCKNALSAGAQFIVSPGLNAKVVEYCLANGVTVLPGCVTPTEIMQAMELGLDTVKFFPANVYGGLKAMKALAAPFTGIKFIPTGGVSAENLAEYLSAPYVRAVGGSWLCAKADVNAGAFDKITELCRQASKIVAE